MKGERKKPVLGWQKKWKYLNREDLRAIIAIELVIPFTTLMVFFLEQVR